ncbi:MAG: DUF5060 domain-containing protein [Fimbriimonadaceae bacterium]|nr:DUF5060 domain-containing protein [Fimbriimonadaceae bacterium]
MARSVLLCLLAATPLVAQTATLQSDGSFKLAGAGLPTVGGSLFLWHDAYVYSVPQEVQGAGEGRTGWLRAAADGTRLTFRVVATAVPGGTRFTYVVRRPANTRLTRGLLLLLQLPLEPLQQRAARFSHSEPVLATAFDGAGNRVEVNLTDQQALRLELDRVVSFERRADSPRSISVNLALLPSDFPADQEVAINLTVSLVPAGPDRVGGLAGSREPLALRGAAWEQPTVPARGLASLAVDLAGTWDNVFDPAQVALDAVLRGPQGQTLPVPGFWFRDYRPEFANGRELLMPLGEPGWRVRCAPPTAGTWQVELTATDRSGQTVRRRGPDLTVTASDLPGVLRPGPHGNVFVREGGPAVFLIGHNVPTYLTGPQTMADCFDKMVAGGENFTRLWMYSSRLGLEWAQPVGTYRLAEAWRLDHAFELARQRDVQLLLCFDTHQDFIGTRFEQNPYHVSRGGPCQTALDFFTNEQARRLYRQRLRYLVARWGWCSNLVAWEFVNEIEGWSGFDKNQEAVAAWHSEMAAELRRLDAYRHPISTSCWTTEGWPTLWQAPGLDFVQSHHYANARVDMAQRAVEICRQKQQDYPGRVHLFGEMGIHYKFAPGQGDDEDPLGWHLHEQNWAALLAGCASVPANWWHEGYFEKHDLYHRFRGVANFARAVDLNQAWRPVECAVAWVQPPARPLVRELKFAPGANSWRPLARPPLLKLLPDGTVEGRTGLPSHLHGAAHRDLKVDFTLQLDLPAAGELILRVGTASDNPRLLVSVDGQPTLDRLFETKEGAGRQSTYQEQWKIWSTRYDEDLSIALPAGPHTVVLRNDGGDWLEIAEYRVPNYTRLARPPLLVVAQSTGREAMLYLKNEFWWWLPTAQGQTIPSVDPVRLTLPPLAPGRYRLELWDTVAGTVRSRRPLTVGPPPLTVDLPAIGTDLALRVVPEG